MLRLIWQSTQIGICVPMASAGYGDNFKKAFSLNMGISKIMASFTYCDNVNGPTGHSHRQSLVCMLNKVTRCSILLEVGVNN